MKIKGYQTSVVKDSGRTGGVSAGKKAGTAGGSQSKPAQQAGVNISASDKITLSQENYAAARSDKVAQIKMKVDSGDYTVDSEKTADALVKSLIDNSLAM